MSGVCKYNKFFITLLTYIFKCSPKSIILLDDYSKVLELIDPYPLQWWGPIVHGVSFIILFYLSGEMYYLIYNISPLNLLFRCTKCAMDHELFGMLISALYVISYKWSWTHMEFISFINGFFLISMHINYYRWLIWIVRAVTRWCKMIWRTNQVFRYAPLKGLVQ